MIVDFVDTVMNAAVEEFDPRNTCWFEFAGQGQLNEMIGIC